MRRIPALRPREHAAARARGAPGTAVAAGTAIGQPRPERRGGLDIADAIVDARAAPLRHGELALEHLAPATNRAERVAPDEKERGVGGHHVAPARADLLLQRFLHARVRPIRGLGDVRELRVRRGAQAPERAHQRQTREPCRWVS
jgi:hypothetical protein